MNWNNVLLCQIQCNHIRFRLCVGRAVRFYFVVICRTCSAVGAVFCVELFFNERFRLFGELFWYFDINRLAMNSDNFSS